MLKHSFHSQWQWFYLLIKRLKFASPSWVFNSPADVAHGIVSWQLQLVSLDPWSSLFSFLLGRSLNIFNNTFSDHFSSSPNIAENLGGFCYVFLMLDYLACNIISKCHSHFTITMKQEWYYMPNDLPYNIHNKIPSNYQRCWAEMKKRSKINFTNKF